MYTNLAAATIAVVLRFLARRVKNQGLCMDDYTLIVALVNTMTLSIYLIT